MSTDPTLVEQAIEAFDAANAADPNREIYDNQSFPKELLYARRMSEELARFAPDASLHLRLAARAQHIERWKSPRADYPEGRAGYKKWRSQLSLFHAQRAAEIMTSVGFEAEDVEKVKRLIVKRGLKTNPETQTLEDVICLVFLKYYFNHFAGKHEEAKVIDIVQKTWSKMSEKGRDAALKISYSENILKILQKSLRPSSV